MCIHFFCNEKQIARLYLYLPIVIDPQSARHHLVYPFQKLRMTLSKDNTTVSQSSFFLTVSNVRNVLLIWSVIWSVWLVQQTCLALPLAVVCLVVGIVVLGSLAFLVIKELYVLALLKDAKAVMKTQGTVIQTCVNQAGWRRLRLQINIPQGRRLRKWVDEDLSNTNHSLGDQVRVILSNDLLHCRIDNGSPTCWKSRTTVIALSFAVTVTTGKALLLGLYVLSDHNMCRMTCPMALCQNGLGIRLCYLFLVGATVYMNLYHFLKQRYYDNFPTLSDYELDMDPAMIEAKQVQSIGSDLETVGLVPLGDDETTIEVV